MGQLPGAEGGGSACSNEDWVRDDSGVCWPPSGGDGDGSGSGGSTGGEGGGGASGSSPGSDGEDHGCAAGYGWDEGTQSCFDPGDVAESGCPAKYSGQWSFVWNGHTFYVVGTVERTTSIKSWPWGEALYRLPPGPVSSKDEKAVYYSGIGRMKCYGYLSKRGQFEGFFHLTWESGDIKEL